jgi:hypothetical protein
VQGPGFHSQHLIINTLINNFLKHNETKWIVNQRLKSTGPLSSTVARAAWPSLLSVYSTLLSQDRESKGSLHFTELFSDGLEQNRQLQVQAAWQQDPQFFRSHVWDDHIWLLGNLTTPVFPRVRTQPHLNTSM